MLRQSTFNLPFEGSPIANSSMTDELKRNIKKVRKQMVSTLTRKKKKM